MQKASYYCPTGTAVSSVRASFITFTCPDCHDIPHNVYGNDFRSWLLFTPVCLLTFLEFHAILQCVTQVPSLTSVYNFFQPKFTPRFHVRVLTFLGAGQGCG